MPLIFPTNPSASQAYQSGSSATYRWNGVYWVIDVAPRATIITATSASQATSASFASTGSSVNSLSQIVTITGSLITSGSTLITGSFAVSTGSGIEFQVLSDGIRVGNLVSDRHQITGSMIITGSLNASGSLFGTASFATSASFVSSPYIYLYGNPSQNINNSSTAYSTNTRIPVNGLIAPYTRGSFTVGATGITPNVTGWYEIHCNVFGLDAGGANTTFSLGIGINGAAIASTLLQSVISGIYGSISVCGVGFATAGQLIDFRAGSTGGELITVQGMNVIVKYISA